MLSTSLTVGDKPYVITAVVTLCGHDAVIAVGGGEAPHVGAAALASSRPSLEQNGGISATASVLCVMGHKDDLLARDAAMRLASRLNTTVLVSVGLHLDQATKEDIRQLQVNFDQMISAIEIWLEQQKR